MINTWKPGGVQRLHQPQETWALHELSTTHRIINKGVFVGDFSALLEGVGLGIFDQAGDESRFFIASI